MYNTILLLPRHLSFASLIFPPLFYLVQWFFLWPNIRNFIHKFLNSARRRLSDLDFVFSVKICVLLLSLSLIFIPINILQYIVYLLSNTRETFYNILLFRNILEDELARVPLVKNSYLFISQEGISNRFCCVKTHSAILLEESTIPATKSWCTSFTFQQLLGSGRLIWMC